MELISTLVLLLATISVADPAQLDKRALAYSPPSYPSPWMDPNADGWAAAYQQAKAFVSQLTLLEKVNLTTGVGYVTKSLTKSSVQGL
jgi:beta-glucosidase